MANTVAVVVAAVGSAAFFAASSAVKHASAAATPQLEDGRPAGLARFARATVRHRLWLLGIACDVGGVTLQVIALHLGSLVVVQPLLISGLIFALLMRRATGRRHVTAAQLCWAGVLAAALSAFMVLAPQGVATAAPDRLPALVAGCIGVAVVSACVILGRRTDSHGGAAALLGTAVGLIYAATAALLKVLSDIAVSDPIHLLVAWQLYLAVGLGGAGLLLNQLAFQAGPLAASLPAASAVDPLASIVIGVAVFDEPVHRLAGTGVVLVILLAVLALSVVALARSAAVQPSSGVADSHVPDSAPDGT